MKYSLDASLRELSARSSRLRRKRKKASICALSCASLILFGSLVSIVGAASSQRWTRNGISLFGALVLPDTAGGYILIGVIAFAVGAAFTLLCLKYRARMIEKTERIDDSVNKEEKNERNP